MGRYESVCVCAEVTTIVSCLIEKFIDVITFHQPTYFSLLNKTANTTVSLILRIFV